MFQFNTGDIHIRRQFHASPIVTRILWVFSLHCPFPRAGNHLVSL